jgi:hypothetical protein
MERARVYRTTGPIRILWGLTLPELIIMAAASGLVLYTVESKFYLELIAFFATLVLSFLLLRFVKMLLKPGAIKHFLTWLREDDHYAPLADTDTMPLVWRLQESS